MRILVRSPNWLGDIIMALPAVAAIKRSFPDAELHVAAPRALAPVFEAVLEVSGIVPLSHRSTMRELSSSAGDAARINATRADLAILLTNSFGSALIVWRAGVAERWGYGRDARNMLLTRAVKPPTASERSSRHHSAYYLDLLRRVNVPVDQGKPSVRLQIPESWRESARERLMASGWEPGRFTIGISPGAAYGHAKRWPPRSVALLIERLVRERSAACVLVGAGADRATGSEVESALDARGLQAEEKRRGVIDLIGKTSLTELMALSALCDVFVSNDSGSMHVASAVGTPVIAPFGPTDEHATAPFGSHVIVSHPVWCRPCLLRECPLDHRCMTGITPDQVFAAIDQLIGGALARAERASA
jgi:heptosyltransferase II